MVILCFFGWLVSGLIGWLVNGWLLFVLFLFIFVCLQDPVSLCSLGCPGTRSVDQSYLELMEIHLRAGIKGVHHLALVFLSYCLSPFPRHRSQVFSWLP